jgi:excinuclease ABC subunit C
MDNRYKILYSRLPETSGVYLMKDSKGRILYVGKAGNLRRRVSSYFLKIHDSRIQRLVSEINKIDYKKTDTAIEALILESKLIKRLSPPYNIREKDDKSFLYVEITKDRFPRVLLVRGKDISNEGKTTSLFGPFTSTSSIREALRILRRIFPWSTHRDPKNPNKSSAEGGSVSGGEFINDKLFGHSDKFVASDRLGAKRPCFDYQIGLCPGTCVGAISRKNYLKNIKNVKLIFEGKKNKILKLLMNDMKVLSKNLEFELAETVRRQIFALKHIQDIALINDSDISNIERPISNTRIEGYDISDISGTSAVGSMVVFINGKPDKSEYRKFRIKSYDKPNDVGMLREILRRRFKNDWPLPNLILVDGGIGQVRAAKNVLLEYNLKIPIIGMAKGPERKRNDIIGLIPKETDKSILIRVRDEAHRFAMNYHKKVRGREFMN